MKIKKNLDLSKRRDRWYALMILGAAIAIFLGTRSWVIALAIGLGLLFLVFFMARE